MRRVVIGSVVSLIVAVAAVAGASAYYAYQKYKAAQNPSFCGIVHKVCRPEVPGKPFNVLVIGSDSRAGLSGTVAAQTGAGSVSGQRSDVVRIFHVNPQAGTIGVVSIPRDTMVTLLANQGLYGNFNRINVNYSGGAALLVRTIEANFGIPINHVVQISFSGLINSVNALGGIYMNFPYPALDRYSSLNIHHAGCQVLNGIQALAVARSRHYEYFANGYWQYDGTSDFGRIDRQDQFIRALLLRAKNTYNPTRLIDLVGAIPSGIQYDNSFGFKTDRARAQVPRVQPRRPQRLHAPDLRCDEPDARRRPLRRPARRPAALGQGLRSGGDSRWAHRAPEPAAHSVPDDPAASGRRDAGRAPPCGVTPRDDDDRAAAHRALVHVQPDGLHAEVARRPSLPAPGRACSMPRWRT